jgi:hypothetical protein
VKTFPSKLKCDVEKAEETVEGTKRLGEVRFVDNNEEVFSSSEYQDLMKCKRRW